MTGAPQIRTWTFLALLHHLRWPLSHMASMSLAISPLAYASYDVLVHQLASLLAASFRQSLAVLPLPFASSYRLITIKLNKRWLSYRGLSPHKFTPMLGVPKNWRRTKYESSISLLNLVLAIQGNLAFNEKFYFNHLSKLNYGLCCKH